MYVVIVKIKKDYCTAGLESMPSISLIIPDYDSEWLRLMKDVAPEYEENILVFNLCYV